jgi:hypothetical protein
LETQSFPNAELAEDFSQQILGIVLADHITDFIERTTQINCYKLWQLAFGYSFARFPHRLLGRLQARLMAGTDRNMGIL